MKRIVSHSVVLILLVGCAHRPVIKKGEIVRGRIAGRTEAVALPSEPNAKHLEGHPIPVVLAVLNFQVNSSRSEWKPVGSSLADLLSTRLASHPGIKIVERQRLTDVMAEMKLDRSGAFDPATVMQVGHMLGANVMVLGSLSELGQNLVLSGRLVKVETGELIGGFNQTTHSKEDLPGLANASADKIAAELSGESQ